MGKLALSVLDLVPVLSESGDAEAVMEAVKLAQCAENAGYRRYWAAEHHDLPGLACASPEVLLAHIGARTERIRLGTGALLLPHNQPLKVAEVFHMLSVLYPDRVDLGVGRAPGGSAHASMALSGNFLERVHRLPEALRDLNKLVQGSYTYEDEPLTARPVPQTPPELWLLGTRSKSAAYAAELGWGFVFGQFMSDADGVDVIRNYRETFVPSRNQAQPKVILAVGAVCAESEHEAMELAAASRMPGGPGPLEEGSAIPAGSGPEEARNRLLAGRPDQVADGLLEMAERYGAEECLIVTMIRDYALRRRSYELLAEAVGRLSSTQ
ncbi:MsnO8 family LLM class oxidoreductase [Gorillibacterium sp. sgz5001074]|uniref:MsnO8 family LLM class oxidoreductase n=1 Tax=Gorillibacterium sp. sgz5001074 TaxID=3446695 RepID=UPI003F66405B